MQSDHGFAMQYGVNEGANDMNMGYKSYKYHAYQTPRLESLLVLK